jgi:hypothetical protein
VSPINLYRRYLREGLDAAIAYEYLHQTLAQAARMPQRLPACKSDLARIQGGRCCTAIVPLSVAVTPMPHMKLSKKV